MNDDMPKIAAVQPTFNVCLVIVAILKRAHRIEIVRILQCSWMDANSRHTDSYRSMTGSLAGFKDRQRETGLKPDSACTLTRVDKGPVGRANEWLTCRFDIF
uniref:Uncharacterized protein n=1 Tax=Angiostrongylus cantonensis TaxID=6313 RepID=A0A0K0CUY3_ANGCA